MVLVRNTTLGFNEYVSTSTRKIFGVGWLKAINIQARSGLSSLVRIANLMPYDAFKIVYLVRSSTASKVRSERVVFLNINKLIITGSYRGSRHKMNHPVRGQRTRSNGNTQRRKRNLSKNVT